MDTRLADFAHFARFCFETAGIAVVLIGSAVAIVLAAREAFSAEREGVLQRFRSRLGRAILLGLEFLVAGDIINTVAFEPTLRSVAVLAAIVAIRSFLSFSIELEISGKWPWQQSGEEGSSRAP